MWWSGDHNTVSTVGAWHGPADAEQMYRLHGRGRDMPGEGPLQNMQGTKSS